MQFRIKAERGAFLGSPVQHLSCGDITEMAVLNSNPASLLPLVLVPGDRAGSLLLTQDLSLNTGSSSASTCGPWDRLGEVATMTPSTCEHPGAAPP